ncbi:MAG: hypothetical protein LBW85_01240 [Deltaproteobacteria bacterium]|jgi:hypothetical protein|nr:hypothetical protein [Deltaproteobacteria bacterium]
MKIDVRDSVWDSCLGRTPARPGEPRPPARDARRLLVEAIALVGAEAEAAGHIRRALDALDGDGK